MEKVFRLYEISLSLNYKEENVLNNIIKHTGLAKTDIVKYNIVRRSLDSRKKPRYNIIIQFTIKDGKSVKKSKYIKPYFEEKTKIKIRNISDYQGLQPIIIGAGPAGLMSALILAENGLKPKLFERGSDADKRFEQINQYLKTGELNVESNILFGEGGAGLFSDGKLTARSKDKITMKKFLDTMVECGADESILIDAMPHIGSDKLMEIIPRLRNKIIEKGGEVHFGSKLTAIKIEENILQGIYINDEFIETDKLILATGHSARDIYKLLSKQGVSLQAKSFAIGVRVEFPQNIVDFTQYGKFSGDPLLEPASYRLTRKPEADLRACYTFCMCPGGEVMPCASSEGMLTTNGMSLQKRDGKSANAGFIVPVDEKDYQTYYDEENPELSGIFFQEDIEKKIFEAGGGDYSVPYETLAEFLGQQENIKAKNISCKRVIHKKITGILPKNIENTLKQAIPKMLLPFKSLDFKNVNIYCGEMRSSSPVRIVREKESYQSVNTEGLYPCGEGAGYSGGIVSSALDGIKVAEVILAGLSE